MHPDAEGLPPPSDWVTRWAARWPAGARVLDLACGRGRHARWLAARGLAVTAVDRNADALAGLDGIAETLCADLEAPGPWPLAGRRFDAVVVTNYLWRPRLADVLTHVAEGGWWLHETFALGQAHIGKPSNPDFLLAPGELVEVAAAAGLRVVAYEDGVLTGPERFVQRIAAVREPASTAAAPPRYPPVSAGPAPGGRPRGRR
ncbi:bifunctional 2-polyprenyl-6-hydroxyphenol methylase/3-demethylubiquinol 3-O-methyltransferase UbiG [Aquabacterium sp. J223]|uniref:class I SAM-dependent methyltransferase n=1 Tax=Aquabacterium sp. J223 TaxID=2898431 RepID=UPI0021ADEA38|nr:class I SAM-dependent methyltransferase [Aquabacterium sp. J223]UUX95175.1 class I SAM-dependent methyltransferase [Aquabacterium sp. J223]